MAKASRKTRPRPVRVPAQGTALLLIDVINDLNFEGADALIAEAEPMALRLAALKRRAARAGVPIVYVNDNFGRWRSDFRQTVQHCTKKSSPGRVVSLRLRPTRNDYFVLKPMHSGFHNTALERLLNELRVRRVIVTGLAGNICVLFTVNDAYMRGLRLYVPSDCVASNTREDNEDALRQIRAVLKGTIETSDRLVFTGRYAPPASARTRAAMA